MRLFSVVRFKQMIRISRSCRVERSVECYRPGICI